MSDIRKWLTGLGLERFADAFEREELTPVHLPKLSDDELKDLGLPLGPRKTIREAIEALRASDTISPPRSQHADVLKLSSEKIPVSTVTPEGERRHLTVLFCDMVGFTELAYRLDPEILQEIVRRYQDHCAVCITRYEGYIYQKQGDGIVAFFGYPLAHEGEAERAIHAGLEIVAALPKLDLPDAGRIAVRIGIATGLVVVSSAEIPAVGETMNLASRLQGIAQPGDIVVSEQVHRLAGGTFDYEDMGEQAFKGIAQRTRAYRIVGMSEATSRFEAATQEGITPLVGREQELGLLLERWALAQDGEGQVVQLCGEPGIGKSRILTALRARLEAQGVQAVRFQCSPYYVNTTLWPSIDNFERALKFGRDEAAESKLDKLEALVVADCGRPLADVRFIASMLSITCEERYGAITITPQKHKDETLRSLVDLAEAVAHKQPTLMVYEDLHWADPSSLEVLDLLIDRVRSFPLLVVLTYRPEFQPRWGAHGHVAGLNMSKLTRAQSSAMVSKLANSKALPAELMQQILAKADGVPLFVEELTKSILESSQLKVQGDRYEYADTTRSITIPATLRDSLMARLDRYMPVKEIAQIGAAIGREFSYEVIAAVSPRSKTELDDSLERLTASGLAFCRGKPPEATYTFKHALVQDAAYDSLLKSRRQELHRKIARVLEERFPNIKNTEPEIVAHHFTEAGLASEAIGYWRRAGQVANLRAASLEAVNSFERAIGLLEELPESTFTLEQGFDIRFELRGPLVLLGEMPTALKRLREAAALAERLDDDRRRQRVAAFMTTVYADLGELDAALVSGGRALEVANRVGDLRLRIVTTTYLEQTHYFRSDYERVVELAIENLAAFPADWIDEYSGLTAPPPVYDRCWLVAGLAQLGRFHEAAEHQADATQLAGARQDVYSIGLPDFAAGTLHLIKGDWTEARSLIEHWIVVSRAANNVFLLPFAIAYSAWALAQLGDKSEAVKRLREGEQLLDGYAARGFIGHLGWFYHCLGRACRLLGRLDEAQRFADRAVKFSSAQPGFEAHALHLLGDVATEPSRFDAERGETHYRTALALAEACGMRPLIAHCHLGLGKLCQRAGKSEQVRDHLAAAMAMYREMNMTYWLEQTEAETPQLQ
jgi:class 3 adenylate cyclase/tetratricopeptide (TPR) repeat protein